MQCQVKLYKKYTKKIYKCIILYKKNKQVNNFIQKKYTSE